MGITGACDSPAGSASPSQQMRVAVDALAASRQVDQTTSFDPSRETLRRMASVDRYNRWIYNRIEPHVGRRVLEVGCGLGNMTPFFFGRDLLVSLDLLPASVEHVRQKYGGQPSFLVIRGDICDESVVGELKPHSFDTVACLNVLEHIYDDGRALRHMRELVQPGGKLILFVPAGSYLYGHLDIALAHHRRYEMGSLASMVQTAGLRIDSIGYMNVWGIPGWFLASRILRSKTPPRGLLRLYNLLAPILIRVEEATRPPFGQSILCIAERADGDTSSAGGVHQPQAKLVASLPAWTQDT